MKTRPPLPVDFSVEHDIRRAATLPAEIYTDPGLFELCREHLFPRTWQLVCDVERVRVPGQVLPFLFLEGLIDEPLMLSRDRDDVLHCLSNVCTHRGCLVAQAPEIGSQLRCRYHGRRFHLDGKFRSMPEFEEAEDFPRPEDDLPTVPFAEWGRFLFASLDPSHPLEEILAPVTERIGWLDFGALREDASRGRDYLVRANWALYCDNYLEGFHIPYVHAGLNEALDYGAYRTEIFPRCNLQVGIAEGAEDAFDLPAGHPDAGQRVAAYYFWVFPNLMLNVYPWGLSINIVQPLAVDRTKVSFRSWVLDPDRLDAGAGAGLDRVEREDEAVVESVQLGVRSRLYRRGRFSPTREQGVHHFHRLLAEALADDGSTTPPRP